MIPWSVKEKGPTWEREEEVYIQVNREKVTGCKLRFTVYIPLLLIQYTLVSGSVLFSQSWSTGSKCSYVRIYEIRSLFG